MKIARSTKEYGSGSGCAIFESDLFRVVLWQMSEGIRTTIESQLFSEEIHFDGRQKFNSDAECIEQYTLVEILKIIEHQKKISFEEGKQCKLDEIKKCFSI